MLTAVNSLTAEFLISLGLLVLLTAAKTACANKSDAFYSTNYEKFGFKNATNVHGSLTVHRPTGGANKTNRICILEKKS